MALGLRSLGPNPFVSTTGVMLAIPRAAEADVRVYDVRGQDVRTLRRGRLEAGELRIVWDGRDYHGAVAAPGIYFVAARVGSEAARLKIACVR